ncbi:TPA: hypothetical protein U1C81_000565 [Streptococcus suis]|nr:hypothetical protein [Streptococcus suis]HEM3666833.1 hypothetical protein [Streptococcus suis]HEM3720809.1 hypothetical protein [Streptococcus suis]
MEEKEIQKLKEEWKEVDYEKRRKQTEEILVLFGCFCSFLLTLVGSVYKLDNLKDGGLLLLQLTFFGFIVNRDLE